jgi:hypothetical protein
LIERGGERERDPLVRPVSFPLGQVLMTPGVQEKIPPSEMLLALRRHAHGDWGDLGEEDRRSNDLSVKDGSRLLSTYYSKEGVKFWIITEADRSATTVLLPDEY